MENQIHVQEKECGLNSTACHMTQLQLDTIDSHLVSQHPQDLTHLHLASRANANLFIYIHTHTYMYIYVYTIFLNAAVIYKVTALVQVCVCTEENSLER